jgi:Adenosine deaminase
MTVFSRDFLLKIPKSDLHLHLDGSLRLKTLIELAQKDNIKLPAYTEEELKERVFKKQYKNLPEYLKGFDYTTAVMQSEKNIERIAYELAWDNINEGVRYIEVRFAPQQHCSKTMTPADSVRAAFRGLKKAQEEYNNSPEVKSGQEIEFHFGLILCAMRYFNKSTSLYYNHLIDTLQHAKEDEIASIASLELARIAVSLKEEKLPIVGFDLAGREDGYPAVDHWKAYQYVHEAFIRKTVHAGESYGPESIFQAITECHANRIGHGTFLFDTNLIKDKNVKNKKQYVEELANYLAGERVGVEVCLTSNLQTLPAIKSVKDHPVNKMMEMGLSLSICTDNRLISDTTLTDEFLLLTKNINLTRKQLRNIVVAGFKGSFFTPYASKHAFVKKVIDKYNQIETQYLK